MGCVGVKVGKIKEYIEEITSTHVLLLEEKENDFFEFLEQKREQKIEEMILYINSQKELKDI